MNDLLNLAANKKFTDFKQTVKAACDLKFRMMQDELRKEVGASYSDQKEE
jgi:hypothetical protein